MIATMRTLDPSRGVVRVEEVYNTGIEDLWQACTTPERLARWIAKVSGDLRQGGLVEATFTSTWTGRGRIETCEAPHHLLVTMDPGSEEETQIEAWLSEEGTRTRLVVEDRGIGLDDLHFHGAGWQVHFEDLAKSLVGEPHPEGWSDQHPAPAWRERWVELTPDFEQMTIQR